MDFDALARAARGAAERANVPGCAVGLLSGDEERTAAFGVTSVEHPLEVDPDTLFQTGSITKTFTGTVAMQLVEERLLDLDAPVRTYLPDFRVADDETASRVTTRHLLTHMPGWIGDYFDDTGRGEDALALMVRRLAELPQVVPLDTIFTYNNAGFYVAGHVLEVVGGAPFEQLVRERLLQPLGLEHSFFFPEEVMTHRFAVGHHAPGEGPVVARPWELPRAANPAGGLTSTVGDLLRYARFQLGGEPGWLARMREQQFEIREGESMGITWILREVDGVQLFGHDGGTNGQVARLLVAPEAGEALAVLTNSSRGSEVTREVTRAFLARFGVQEREPVALDAGPSRLAEYAGRYVSHLIDIDVTLAGPRLVTQMTSKGGFPRPDSPPMPAPPPVPIALADGDIGFVPEGPFRGERVEFLRDETGRIAWLRDGVRLYKRA
ncbi:MAG: serine hydrolase domain-containing protein [Gaiellaceae bacterium]